VIERRGDAPAPASAAARPAVDLVLEARGQIRIEDLARRLDWNARRLERSFLHDLGIRPKLFARIVRLNAVLARLGRDEREAAVDIALEAGYFDQAHLLRDFRILAGRTPRAGSAGDGELARHFTRPERLRALFAGE
jgi:transcriptional regulator GlxA family with amidase domain